MVAPNFPVRRVRHHPAISETSTHSSLETPQISKSRSMATVVAFPGWGCGIQIANYRTRRRLVRDRQALSDPHPVTAARTRCVWLFKRAPPPRWNSSAVTAERSTYYAVGIRSDTGPIEGPFKVTGPGDSPVAAGLYLQTCPPQRRAPVRDGLFFRGGPSRLSSLCPSRTRPGVRFSTRYRDRVAQLRRRNRDGAGLCSSRHRFCFASARAENVRQTRFIAVTNLELPSRLSFFIWGSMYR